ncbi:PACE efflux transporter [Pikeienuella sp. HZG-20]|uniref:PACE efflux transporter n=1 Tax=Paludibacillus litoralis TaxID=3133267 RepID=UPI0030EF0E0E
MTDQTILRSGRDRLRCTISFEMILMAMLIPAGAAFFDKSLSEIGLLGMALSLKAMVLNLAYNWVFDRIDARSGRISSERSHLGRILHAVGFEFSLIFTSLPIYMLWLKICALEALAADLVVTTFVVGYTYVFTLAYDKAFPLVRPQAAGA